jgi:starch synthase
VEAAGLPAPVLLVSHESFDRPGIYVDPKTGASYPDDASRWTLFCRALHGFFRGDGWTPDVVHLHDHQTSLLGALIRWAPTAPARPRRSATVFTIHNLGYQGIEPLRWARDSGLPPGIERVGGPLEFHGRANLMKLGIESADWLTTVSPRYAVEITEQPEFGCGLEGVLSDNRARLTGILNGIDTTTWDPAVDPHLPFRYTRDTIGIKAKNKAALRAELGLATPDSEVPLAGMVSRLATQKGFDLLLPILPAILEEGVQVAILGSGEARIESALRAVAATHLGRMVFRSGHDEKLAHRIEGGADMFLMPSRYEPCGLNQMYSLRYGTVPVVRSVGGLADTVVDLEEDPGRANGFAFRVWEPAELLGTVRRAVRAWRDPALWDRLRARGMDSDFSWRVSAHKYAEVFARAMSERDGDTADRG